VTADLVVCEQVTRVYKRGATVLAALQATSCRVAPGERIAVTGSSGSGKSTLLHLLAGLDRPTTGRVRWPGLDAGPAGRPRGIGVVFQGPSLLPPLDVLENVALPLVLADVPEAEARRRAMTALEHTDAAALAPRLPEELSGGQAQRVAVARVLASEPRLILADEPTGQLDAVHRDQIIAVLLETADRLGAGVLVSTHDPLVAAQLDVQWRLRDGIMTELGPTAADAAAGSPLTIPEDPC
jgi:putative ABC transport system ATP-binding protein